MEGGWFAPPLFARSRVWLGSSPWGRGKDLDALIRSLVMSMSRSSLIAIVCLGARLICAARDGRQSTSWLDQTDAGFTLRDGLTKVQSGRSSHKRSCSQVYPIPEATQHWTDCKAGQFSQCGGPEDCACDDPKERLVWHDCKEGSYARCEDDDTCVDSCRY
jgi:hypothetical protein